MRKIVNSINFNSIFDNLFHTRTGMDVRVRMWWCLAELLLIWKLWFLFECTCDRLAENRHEIICRFNYRCNWQTSFDKHRRCCWITFQCRHMLECTNYQRYLDLSNWIETATGFVFHFRNFHHNFPMHFGRANVYVHWWQRRTMAMMLMSSLCVCLDCAIIIRTQLPTIFHYKWIWSTFIFAYF